MTTKQISLDKLITHCSLSLKSFDLTVSKYDNQFHLGHLQSLYKKKKYIFFIIPKLTLEYTKKTKFTTTVASYYEKGFNFVVITNEWEQELDKFVEKNDLAFKIIPFKKLNELGMKYIEAKEREGNSPKL